jgi:hypothetical protein
LYHYTPVSPPSATRKSAAGQRALYEAALAEEEVAGQVAEEAVAESEEEENEAVMFEEAAKVGRDLIRGLLPTPLIAAKTKPRWTENANDEGELAAMHAAADNTTVGLRT